MGVKLKYSLTLGNKIQILKRPVLLKALSALKHKGLLDPRRKAQARTF